MSDFLARIGYAHWALTALLVIPLVGVIAVWAAPSRAAKSVALTASLVELAVSLGLWVAFDPGVDGMQFEWRRSWIGAYGVSFHVGIDGVSLTMVLLTTILTPLAILGSFEGIKTKERGFYA